MNTDPLTTALERAEQALTLSNPNPRVGCVLVAPDGRSVRTLRGLMALFVVAGITGVGLHFRGAAEFQAEMDPGQSRWALVTKSLHAKAPPVLAPGLMVQVGLLGLLSTYRHPALAGGAGSVSAIER